jgi:hypothetical protein
VTPTAKTPLDCFLRIRSAIVPTRISWWTHNAFEQGLVCSAWRHMQEVADVSGAIQQHISKKDQ